MIILNKTHWFFIYITLFLIFFLFALKDVKNEMSNIFKKQTEEKNLLHSIENNKKILLNTMNDQQRALLQPDNRLLDTSSVLSYFSRVFSEQGITIRKIQLLKIKTIEGMSVLPVKVSAMGIFPAFYKLISVLSNNPRPIVVDSFSFKVDKKRQMIAEMQFLVFAIRAEAIKARDSKNNIVSIDNLINKTSLKKMKWVGFIRNQNTTLGLLMLPEGMTFSVQVGLVIGIERGKVIEVKEDGVIINLAGKILKIASDRLS